MSFWNALASVYGTHQQNKNIDKQLAAQKQEQQQNRLYNLELAKQQNAWNIEQWNRENAYNSPSAQMERMRQAGLNPDMMYGGGVSGNLAASSPQMTSGAPSSPMDWSSLANKKTVADTLMQKAQLDNLNAQTEKVKSETKGKDLDNYYKPIERAIGIQLSQQQIEENKVSLDRLRQALDEDKLRYESMSQELLTKQMMHAFKAEEMQLTLKKLANDLELSDNEVKNMLVAKALELRGKELDNVLKEYAVKWEDPGVLDNLGGKGLRTFLQAMMMLLK